MTGMLVVHSQPAGREGEPSTVRRAASPRSRIEGLSTGDHEVAAAERDGFVAPHREGARRYDTASLVAPVVRDGGRRWVRSRAGSASRRRCWFEIREDGQLIGTTETDRLMLASGKHVLEFVNQTLGYRQSRTVQVLPGKAAPITIDMPQGTVNLNASPWAEVWIDGQRVGETPIGNLSVPSVRTKSCSAIPNWARRSTP
jgi:hypothetical protein